MVDALIIDACRTPRGIGKAGKGALSGIHPQRLGATVLRALADRTGIDTADVDDIIWGTSSQRGPQSGDLGRMSALDAGYDVRASGVTLDRFCGSGITSVNMAAASIMSGSEDLVIAGGTEMMSMEGRRGEGPFMMDNGNLHLRALHPQSHQGVCADAVATLEGITREDVDGLGFESQQRAANAIRAGHFAKSLVPVYREDGSLALDREEYPRPQTTLEGLAGLKPAFTGGGGLSAGRQGHDLPQPDPAEISRARHQFRAPRRQFVGGCRWLGSTSAGFARLRQGARPEAARTRGGDGEYGRFTDADAERTGAGRA